MSHSTGDVHDSASPSDGWLKQFSPRIRTSFGLIFRGEYRRGYGTPEALLRRIRSRLIREYYPNAVWAAGTRNAVHVSAIDEQYESALQYAMWIIEDEQLPPEEREARKAARRPPTPGQLAYLTGLGYQGAAPETHGEVSREITRLKKEKEARVAEMRRRFSATKRAPATGAQSQPHKG